MSAEIAPPRLDTSTFVAHFVVAVDFQHQVPIAADTPLDSLPEWDSLAALGVIVMCGAEYGPHRSRARHLKARVTVGDILDRVRLKLTWIVAKVNLRNVRVRGIASCVPKSTISNLDCADEKRSERERLVRNIGIMHRRICYPWVCFSDLAKIAAERLLEEIGWQRDEIDVLIVVTQSPDYPIPATAIILQDRLKLRHGVIAYDINLGCSGYPFGLYSVGSMLASGGLRKALLLVGDRCATLNDPLFFLIAVRRPQSNSDPDAPPIPFDMNSDGSGYRAIIFPVGGHSATDPDTSLA